MEIQQLTEQKSQGDSIGNGSNLPAKSYHISFSITPFETSVGTQFFNTKLQRNEEFKILWITKGQGIVCIDLKQIEISNNEIYCISPGCVHFFQAFENCYGFILSFSPELLYLFPGIHALSASKNILANISGTRFIDNDKEKIELENIIKSMQREFDNYAMTRPNVLAGWLMMFLIYLRGLVEINDQRGIKGKNIELVDNFYCALEKQFFKKKMVADYAYELCVTPNYLNEIVKRVSGYPASHHIQQRIIIEAKRLSIYSNESMKEIAYRLGFGDISYFSKFFKHFAGLNFKEFKKRGVSLSI